MARMRTEPCPMSSQLAQPRSMAYQDATAMDWQYRPPDVKNGQQQGSTSRNGAASLKIHGPAVMAAEASFHWRDRRPAVYTCQQPEHHSYLPSLPIGPVYPTSLETQRQNQCGNRCMSWYGASPAAGGTSRPQQAQQSSPTTALCLPRASNQMPPPLISNESRTNRITSGDQAKKKARPAVRPTRAVYPRQQSMMFIWRAKNRQSSRPQEKSTPQHATYSNDTNKNQASKVPNRTDRVSKVPFNRERRFDQARLTAFPADLNRGAMELPPLREHFREVFANALNRR